MYPVYRYKGGAEGNFKELIKCIGPNEGEALKRGREGGGGREGGKGGGQAGGREGQRGQKEILPEGGIDQMY